MENFSAEQICDTLLCMAPQLTSDAPKNARGIYGLIDHFGALRYIGSTSSTKQSLYTRIHQRHRTGSEDSSHYFSRMYNTGRMWRLRNDPDTKADGDIAKHVRNEFIHEYCRAVWVPLPDTCAITDLEATVLKIAPKHAIVWNERGMDIYEEPKNLVDALIAKLGLDPAKCAALERQRDRYLIDKSGPKARTNTAESKVSLSIEPAQFPTGPMRLIALDVETANNDRSSICQIGVACVMPDNSIKTWSRYVNPQTSDWFCTSIHGINANSVSKAPTFPQIFSILARTLAGTSVFQHSKFDSNAIAAACAKYDLEVPSWDWRDSIDVAKNAWPELKNNGGYGLASLKRHLGLTFEHHDAEEDARASAEIVLRAESRSNYTLVMAPVIEEGFEVIEPMTPQTAPQKEISKLPIEVPQTSAPMADAVVVPRANDASVFHPDLARKGNYTIGPKGGEHQVDGYEEALWQLLEMNEPRWRRPNSAGNWGIVKGTELIRVERADLMAGKLSF